MITRRAVELIAVLLAALVGIFAPAAVEATAIGLRNDGLAEASAATFTYDATAVARVDVHSRAAAGAAPALLSDAREESAPSSVEARGPSTAPTVTKNATNAVDELLPGLPAGAPKPVGLGSTGRVAPGNLTEQLAMTEVRSAPAGQQLTRVVMTDARWPAADGWVKMSQNVNGVEIHYVRNTVTGAVDDFKFIGGAG